MARNLLSTRSYPSAEARSWFDTSAEGQAIGAFPRPSAASQLNHARDTFTVLAKAQRGLECDSKADSVTLSFSSAPGVEAAVVEAAERFSATGDLVLERGPMWVRLRVTRVGIISDRRPRSNPLRPEASAE